MILGIHRESNLLAIMIELDRLIPIKILFAICFKLGPTKRCAGFHMTCPIGLKTNTVGVILTLFRSQ